MCEKDKRRREQARQLMSALGVQSVDELLRIAADESRSSEDLQQICSIFGLLRVQSAIPRLIYLLNKEETTQSAAIGLGLIRSRIATRRLLQLVNAAKSETVRRAAISALGMLKDPRSDALMCHVLLHSLDEDTRRVAACALTGGRPRRRTTAVLIEALTDESAAVRWQVLSALGTSNDRSVTGIVQEYLLDHSIVARLPEDENTVSWAARNALNCLGCQ